jgi:hypothetical protein
MTRSLLIVPSAKFWKIGTTEEGRDIVVLAIADEATIASLDACRSARRADRPRDDRRPGRQLLDPVTDLLPGQRYAPENGGPEMLIELAYRLIVEESPFIQNTEQRDHLHHAGDRSGRT